MYSHVYGGASFAGQHVFFRTPESMVGANVVRNTAFIAVDFERAALRYHPNSHWFAIAVRWAIGKWGPSEASKPEAASRGSSFDRASPRVNNRSHRQKRNQSHDQIQNDYRDSLHPAPPLVL